MNMPPIVSDKIVGVSGYTIVRNALSLDYCVEAAIASLLPICDEVVVCDSNSTDGTDEMLAIIASKEPKVRVINRPWPSPHGQPTWFVEWINWTRGHLRYSHQLQLDADEVLGPESHAPIRHALKTDACLWFKRLNFWSDAQHIAQSGDGGLGIGDGVARFGRTEFWMPSDEPHEVEPEIRKRSLTYRLCPDPNLNIYHYGFLRLPHAFIAKSRACLEAWFATKDERIERAAAGEEHWMTHVSFEKPLIPFKGKHPECIRAWLWARGYTI